MKWLNHWDDVRERISYYHQQEKDEHRAARLKQEKLWAERNENRIRQEIYRRQLKKLSKLRGVTNIDSRTEEEIELLKKLYEIKTEDRERLLKLHNLQFHSEREDFNHYYRHINRTRPFVLILNLSLWFLLFWFGGVSMGLKIVILLFALATTIGSFFEISFSLKVKDRILRPLEKLTNGVAQITKGNYDVSVTPMDKSEISTLITAFNEMARKLKESEKIKAEYEENRKALIANISHDLKTPITSIEGYIEAITSKDIPAEKMDAYLKVIHSNAAYMNRLIDDLFLFAKLDMQKLDFHFEEQKIKPLVGDMMEEFKIDLQEKEVGFEFENALMSDPTVKLDAKRFYQVIRNMIDNAVKYGPPEKLLIKTKLYEKDGFVCIDIADNGPGISPESLPHVFERFYRADAGRTKDLSSTGLGLAIARELTHAHGGEITVKSNLNEGACFTISIPCFKEA